jgi:hypothetical protein
VVSLVDPENPDDINTVSTPAIHDVYARNDTVYVAEGNAHSFSIYDLSDKESPELLARVSVPGGGYVHNIWPTDDGTHVMTTEETTGKTVKMWDIRDMNNIDQVGEYLGVNSIAHNTHIMGDFAYISHYTAGVTVVDISDPTNLVEVARYDTYPLNDNPGFQGCWGAFPFTQNGMVFASDLEGYLTVLQFTETDTTVFVDEPGQIPNKGVLHQNYPNPFNPRTVIHYDVPETAPVRLVIYDILGRNIRTLVNGVQEPGYKTITWNGADDGGRPVSAGMYIVTMASGSHRFVRKMVLLK